MISLCMITKNEEKHLARCLSSVIDFVDEIIIVDTGSSDNTIKIAESFGAKVKLINYKWNDDFSKARNESLRYAKGDWILILDPDEIVLKEDLIKLKGLTKEDVLGYSFVQRNYSNKKAIHKWRENDFIIKEAMGFEGFWVRGITRLFRNRKDIEFVYPIHETVLPSIKKLKEWVRNSGITIHHLPSHGKEGFYYKLLQKKIKQCPAHRSYAELAVHCFDIGKLKEGKRFAEKAIELNKDMAFLRRYFR